MKVEGVLEKKGKENKNQKIDLTRTLILGLVGLILALMPDFLNKVIGILVGAALLIGGLASIYQYIQNKEGNNLTLASGILYAVLGSIIMLYPHSVIRLVAICLGVYLLITGLLKFRSAFLSKSINDRWIGTLIVSLIILIFGLLLIFNPFSGIAITKLAGIFLVVVAIFEVIDVYIFQSNSR